MMRWSGWLRAFRRKLGPQASESGTWTESLGQVIADLERLNLHTEQHFLGIGGRLAEFIEQVDLVSSDLEFLADMLSTQQVDRASSALTWVLERFTKIKARAEEGNGVLGGMLRDGARIKQTLYEFKGTVTTLTTLGVLTQIETARLGAAGADFGPLANDVKSVSGSVQESVENALDAARHLIPPDRERVERCRHTGAATSRRVTLDDFRRPVPPHRIWQHSETWP